MAGKTQTLKGFRDALPKEALRRAWLKEQIVKTFEAWGYDPMETPALEPLELFEGQIGEDEKLFYKFEDPGGRKVALRYDQTVPASRVVGQYSQELGLPLKRYQIQSAFRAEKPQKGRYREFLQADADIFGVASPVADAEVIAISLDIYKRLGFTSTVALISDRELLKDLPYKAIVAIDKLDKIGKDGVIADMVDKGMSKGRAIEYLDSVKNIKPNEALKTIFKYLQDAGFDKSSYKFEPKIARSFSYSTGPIWEIQIPEYSGGSVLGGERYDQLVKEVSGKQIEGTGFALGFDRTLEAAEELGLIPDIPTQTDVLVTVFNPEFLPNSLKVASELRSSGVNVDTYPSEDAKLDKQLKYADRKGIPFAIIIGPEEVESESVTLKNLRDSTQTTLSVKQAIELITKN